ncbi:MAG: DNA repair exonuclease, partial [Alicyclobacillus sp.]|nr:DNA repair exonuclease [Alicyclobacillus sp.]
GLEGAEGHERYAPCRLQDLVSKGYDYWALGHIHQRQVVHERPWVVYSGNLQGRHVRETGDKGCYLVTVEGRDVRLEYRSLDVLRWSVLEVNLTGADQPEEVLERIRAAVDARMAEDANVPLALRIDLVGQTPLHGYLVEHPGRWRAEAMAVLEQMDRPVWLEKLRVRTDQPPVQAALASRGEAWRVLQESVAAAMADEEFVQACLNDIRRVQQRLGPYLHRPDATRVEGVQDLHGLAADATVLLGERLKGNRT